jgi:hypothetical protein
MSDGVTQFPNALQITNNTANCLTLYFQSNGSKQLFSPSFLARNVPDGGTSDGYTLMICPNSTYALGQGIYRDSDYTQSAIIQITASDKSFNGTLTFNQTQQVNGDNIKQSAFWSGSTLASLQVYNPPLIWDFNNPNNQYVGLTFS